MPPRAFLSPEEMFPAGRIKLRTWRLRLASGLRVRIVETGDEAAAPVLFVPGWGCSTYIFRETLTAVAFAGFRVIAAELKGHGLSDKPTASDEYTTDAMCRHLSEIVDALDAGPVHLVGHSMGAAIAAHTAAIAPEKIISLVLVSPVGFAGVPGMSVLRTVTPNASLAMIRRVTTHGMIRRLLGFVYGRRRRANDRDVEEFRAPVQF
ncbi:MAG: alpha/beta hydrolase, partial [Gemmatimonadota bacterium]|nr:alpha/beta hydrolase [Gemmatimonadota bacterium]